MNDKYITIVKLGHPLYQLLSKEQTFFKVLIKPNQKVVLNLGFYTTSRFDQFKELKQSPELALLSIHSKDKLLSRLSKLILKGYKLIIEDNL